MATRIITAVIGLAIAVVIMFFSHTIVFNIAVAALAAMMVYEALNANKCTDSRFSFVTCVVFASALPFFKLDVLNPYITHFLVLFALLMLMSYLVHFEKLTIDKLSYMLTMTLLISASMYCMLSIREIERHGLYYVCLTLAAPWLSDAGAYFVGVSLGKHKLCPSISPKKTIEGAIGGVIINIILFTLACLGYKMFLEGRGEIITVNYLLAGIIAVASAFLAIIGDLVASLIKRQTNIKDFGKIMPGHGGALDRFDSVLFVAPVMLLILRSIQIFN